jgi:putative redox protein
MTARQFAERRKWPLTGVRAHLTAENVGGKYSKIEVELTLEGDLTDEQRQRLRDVAERCLVSKTLAAGVPIVLR